MTKKIETDSNEKVIELCQEYLGGEWLTANKDDIIIKPITIGFANRTFHCILKQTPKDEKCPKEVVVKLYGNELVGERSLIKVNGEAAEGVVVYRLSQLNLSPKVYGVFDGGRIEGYIEHTNSTPEYFRSSEAQAVVARKLAFIHKLDMPVSKVPKYFRHLLSAFKSTKLDLDMNSISDSDKKYVKTLFTFPIKEEIKWMLSSEQRVKSRIVYSHNDFNLNNIVIRDNYKSLDEQVFVMDYETSGYYYRGFDIAYFMQSKHFRYVREKEETVKDYFEHSFTNEEYRNFLEEYLKEWKKDNPNYDEKLDTLDNLQRETHFFGLQEYLLRIAFFMKAHNMPEVRVSMALSEYILNMYSKRKEEYIEKYGDPIKP